MNGPVSSLKLDVCDTLPPATQPLVYPGGDNKPPLHSFFPNQRTAMEEGAQKKSLDEGAKKKSVLVTGATGFLGDRLCHILANQGRYHVKALARPTSNVTGLPPAAELVHGDVTDAESLVRALYGCAAIFHCAALVTPWCPDPSRFTVVNVIGLRNVIDAVQKTPSIEKFVYISSFFALGPSNGHVVDETQIHPGHSFCTEYEKSKAEADAIALEEARKGLPIVLTYPGVIYGPGKITEGNSLLSLLVERCHGRLPGHIGSGKDKLSFCHVDDVAQGCILAMEKGKQGERYLLTGENASFDELLDIVDGIRGKAPSSFRTPLWMLDTVGRLSVAWARLTGHSPLISYPMVQVLKKQWAYTHEKAKQELGYHSRSLKQGMAEFLAWMQSSGLIKKL